MELRGIAEETIVYETFGEGFAGYDERCRLRAVRRWI
jgi:hypothetical protein